MQSEMLKDSLQNDSVRPVLRMHLDRLSKPTHNRQDTEVSVKNILG